MVKICETRLLKLNFEIIPKKRIFRFLPKISAGHAWSWKNFFANFQILGPLGCQGWVVIPQNVKKKSKSLHPSVYPSSEFGSPPPPLPPQQMCLPPVPKGGRSNIPKGVRGCRGAQFRRLERKPDILYYSMCTSGFWPRVRARALRAPFFLGSLLHQQGRCAPPRPSQLRCFLFDPQN